MPPVAAKSWDGINKLEHSGEGQVTSEAWSMSKYSSSPKGQPLHQSNSSDNPANDSESPKAPSTIFNLNYTVLYTTLRTQLYTQLYSTQQLQPIIRYSVPSLQQGGRPHRSVGSTPRIHLLKVGGWNQDMIDLEIEEVLEKNSKWLLNWFFSLKCAVLHKNGQM